MNYRLTKLYRQLEKNGLDALILSNPANISYLTNTLSRDSYFLAAKPCNTYFTDSRYTREAGENLKDIARVKKINGSVFKIIADSIQELKLRRVGFEERHLPFAEYKKIKLSLPESIKLLPIHGLVEALRQIKDKEELTKIKKAVEISIEALNFIKGFISAKKRELEIAAEIERFIRYKGASGSSFEIIAASREAASYPHYKTSHKKIKDNAPLLIDMGVDYQGYKSDLTRVFFVGKMNRLMRQIYDIVLTAQEKAISLIEPDVPINKIDTAARQFIASKGYGANFCHSLGHGVGLEVHEEPQISQKEPLKLKEGMCFTIEPAIYLPGKFGIRW